jgi:hypothetical protein
MSSLFGKLFGSKQKTVTQPTQFQTMPEFARIAMEEAVARGSQVGQDAFVPAGFTPSQMQAQQFLSQAGPQLAEAPAIDRFNIGEVTGDMGAFMNPYEEQVVANTLADIQRGGRGMWSDISQLASGAGGFGGTRQALLESELQRNLMEEMGQAASGIRQQGFNTALQGALQAGGLRGQRISQQQQAAQALRGAQLQRQQLEQQRAGQLFDIGETQRQRETLAKYAPAQRASFLANLAIGAPAGGGTIGFAPRQPGLVNRVVEPASRLISAFSGG